MSSDTHETGNGDYQFLERVLDKLYDFGQKKSQKKKKRKRQKEEEEEQQQEEEEEEEEQRPAAEGVRTDTDSRDTKDELQQSEPTGSVGQRERPVQVITFHDPRKKRQSRPTAPTVEQMREKIRDEPSEELSLEKARLEVHRFGITGYKKEQQRGFEQERAVMLGARPPKKQYVNYKILQEQIKEKKQKERDLVEPELKKKKKKKPRDQKKPSSSSSGLAPSGQVGRFKNGMLVLSSKEIQRIKSKRGK